MLRLTAIAKRFGATKALDDVSFSLAEGEICGLVGHNGAGKSTLIKIIAGAQPADSGAISIDGRPVAFASPNDAHAAGIRVIHQDAPLIPGFDTVENCWLGRPYPKKFGRIDRKVMRAAIATVARDIAPNLPLDIPVAQLPPAEKQFVRLLRAIADQGRFLILDEPTAALPAEDAEKFFVVLQAMRARGTAILLTTHRLDEIATTCARTLVLRDGRLVAELTGSDLTVPALITAMGGSSRAIEDRPPIAQDALVVLTIQGLISGELRIPVSLDAHSGEVIALYGLSGSGRSSLLQAVWGAERVTAGSMRLDGEAYAPRSPRDAVRAGVSYVPADRHKTGLFASFDLVFNKTLPLLASYRQMKALPLPDRKAERAAFAIGAERVGLKFNTPDQPARTLSGGNQQKLLFARWANRHSKIMLLDEPTEGVDVMAKANIKDIVRDIAADGNAVLVSTSDREEALELGDRVAVFRDGAIVKIFTRAEATAEALSTAAQAKLHPAKAVS